jgi:hypothetical protein
MTPKDYQKRIDALGFTSGASWARFVGINRSSYLRHIKGDMAIPQIYWNVIEWLETGDLRNPND